MNWIWIVAILVGIPIAWQLLNVLLGVFLPRSVTGAALLQQELKKYGVRPYTLPRGFLAAVAKQCWRISRFAGKSEGETPITYFEKMLTHGAYTISLILKGQPVEERDPVARIAREMNIGPSKLES